MSSQSSSRRDAALALVQGALPAHMVRWADARTTRGDFDGRENTIDVFGVPFNQQREIRRQLRAVLETAESLLGRPVVLVFHTPEATARHYSDLMNPTSAIEDVTFDGPILVRAQGDLSHLFRTTIDPPSVRLEPAA